MIVKVSKSSIPSLILVIFFFNDTATTEIYTLSLHDALPISARSAREDPGRCGAHEPDQPARAGGTAEEPAADARPRQVERSLRADRRSLRGARLDVHAFQLCLGVARAGGSPGRNR